MWAQDRDLAIAASRTGQREYARRRWQTQVLRYLPFKAGIGEKTTSDLGI